MALDVQVSEKTINSILEDVAEVATETGKQTLEEEVDPELYAAAQEFNSKYQAYLTWANEMERACINYRSALKRLRNAKRAKNPDGDKIAKAKEDKNEELRKLRQDQTYITLRGQLAEQGQIITQAQLNFQQQLNKTLGHKMRTYFITSVEKDSEGNYVGGEIFYFDTDEIAQYLTYIWDAGAGEIGATYGYTKELQVNLERIDIMNKRDLNDKEEAEGMAHLKWARYSAEQRWTLAKNQKVIYEGTTKKAAIMWHDPPDSKEWVHIWVDGIATITEAYGSVVIKNEEKEFAKYNNIHKLLTIFKPYLLEADNASGVIVGDTSTKDIDEAGEEIAIEAAIKDITGQVLGLKQFYTKYAKPILFHEDNFNKEKLKNTYNQIKNSQNKGHKTIERDIKDIAQDSLEKLIKDLNALDE